MESELDEIEEQLEKLHSELGEATGRRRSRIEEEIEKLEDRKAEIAASGDIVLASGDDHALQNETTDARLEIETDIP